MEKPLAVSIELMNQKVKFACRARDQQPISVDYTPPIGDGEGYTSLELLLVSLATCVGTGVLTLLRKMRKEVSGLRITASGVRRTIHPTSFETIDLDLNLTTKDVTAEDMDKVLKLAEDSICPVWAMIKGNTTVRVKYILE
jgi:putative redox protein